MLSQFLWVNGRSGRLQWWMTQLVQIAILAMAIPLMLPDGFSGLTNLDGGASLQAAAGASPLLLPVILCAAWLGLVANIRRYHDRNKTGWWVLCSFVPLIGPLWQFIELGFLRGSDGDNHYGPAGGTRSFGGDDADQPGSLAKVDDSYLAEYAKRYAAEQAAKSAPRAAAVAAPVATGPSLGGSFGKRR